jgi:hypothetical protein
MPVMFDKSDDITFFGVVGKVNAKPYLCCKLVACLESGRRHSSGFSRPRVYL